MKGLGLLPLLLLVAGTFASADEGEPPLAVWVSVPPQAEIVARVGGDRVTVEVLVEPGRSPETYAPTSRRLAELSGADLYVRTGLPFERTLVGKLASLAPGLHFVDAREGLELMPMHPDHGRHGGADEDHHHEESDPHVWLDPQLVARQAATIAATLCLLDPCRCELFTANSEDYSRELGELDRRLGALLAPYHDRSILVFHPAYGYFARRYQLRQLSVEVGGKEPTPRQLAALVETARAESLGTLFVQPQLAGRSADAAARALGAEVVELDPLAPDLAANLERMARRVAAALGG